MIVGPRTDSTGNEGGVPPASPDDEFADASGAGPDDGDVLRPPRIDQIEAARDSVLSEHRFLNWGPIGWGIRRAAGRIADAAVEPSPTAATHAGTGSGGHRSFKRSRTGSRTDAKILVSTGSVEIHGARVPVDELRHVGVLDDAGTSPLLGPAVTVAMAFLVTAFWALQSTPSLVIGLGSVMALGVLLLPYLIARFSRHRWRVVATHRGRTVVLFESSDRREADAFVRALRRAMEARAEDTLGGGDGQP